MLHLVQLAELSRKQFNTFHDLIYYLIQWWIQDDQFTHFCQEIYEHPSLTQETPDNDGIGKYENIIVV